MPFHFPDGYHPVYIGEKYHAGRYTVLKKLGWGHFSTVWLVVETHTGKYGAMKVSRKGAMEGGKMLLLGEGRDTPRQWGWCLILRLASAEPRSPVTKEGGDESADLGEKLGRRRLQVLFAWLRGVVDATTCRGVISTALNMLICLVSHAALPAPVD